MTKGEKILVEIPSHLAYGKEGVDGVIPPDSTLKFVIEVVNVKPENW